MENYIRYQMMGGYKRLKKGVLPHKFDCQKNETVTERPGYKKRKEIAYLEKVLSPNIHHENLIPQEEFVACEFHDSNTPDIIDPIAEDNPCPTEPIEDEDHSHKSVAVQVNLKTKFRSTGTNTNAHQAPKLTNATNKTQKEPLNDSFTSYSSIVSTVSVSQSKLSVNTSDNLDTEVKQKVETELFKTHMKEGTLMAISREPKLFLGWPSQVYFCLQYLSENVERPLVDVLLTLKKLRWREPNAMLAVHFGCAESTVAKRFKETLPKMSQCLKRLVFIPPREDIRSNLPIPFRRRYGKVTCIIDCLEIQIEKPSSALHQALTWSQYKNSNTVKYLISITPDGLISYISEGYGGRTSDAVIFEDCGFLQKLSPGDVVMADRGFKNIAHLLERQDCKLLRPPSVSSGSTLKESEVLETKRIAALRVHVERSIGRLREFEMIAPHACVDIEYVKILDFLVTSACGVVNLQGCLFRNQV